jgi:carbon-monoxide dehydrogenase medium subunit
VIEGIKGERSVPFDQFFQGFFLTAVGPGELVTRVEFDLPPEGTGHGFWEVANRADDFATAAATALVTVDERGTCAEARVALAGVGDRPARCEEAEEACRGEALEKAVLDEVARAVEASISPEDDAFVSADYRRRAAAVCAQRALAAAWRRARDGVA